MPNSMTNSAKESRPPLRPPQFGLRALLLLVTACGVLCALAQWLSPIAIAAIVFLIVSIAAHVAGNAIGTRLRQSSPARGASEDSKGPIAADQPRPMRPSRLTQRRQLGWPILVATCAGAIGGCVAGSVWTFLAQSAAVSALSVGVGIVAFSILGAFASFLIFGFMQVGLAALYEAQTIGKSLPPNDS